MAPAQEYSWTLDVGELRGFVLGWLIYSPLYCGGQGPKATCAEYAPKGDTYDTLVL